MSPALPDGSPAPADGALPGSAAVDSVQRAFSLYIHVPYCRVRCGYCDFNTYTAKELGEGVRQDTYAGNAIAEMRFAQRVLSNGGIADRALSTVFFGGGTPTLLPAEDLGAMLREARDIWGLSQQAEVTTEANPDSVTPDYLQRLAAAGFTRVSFGMQSAVPHVLKVLDRTHDPARVPEAVAWAKAAGLRVSLDVIYGTPGESLDDWNRSLQQVIDLEPDHVSAYALIIEEGTRLYAQIKRGDLPSPDDDDLADKYEVAESMLSTAGLSWYEVSNWSRTSADECQHNLAYWRSSDWWGIGPGAHSHIGGTRWWNVKHPAAYAHRVGQGISPAAAREVLTSDTVEEEQVLLRVRLREGLPVTMIRADKRSGIAGLIADGLIDAKAALRGTVVLTLRGRLLADLVVRHLV